MCSTAIYIRQAWLSFQTRTPKSFGTQRSNLVTCCSTSQAMVCPSADFLLTKPSAGGDLYFDLEDGKSGLYSHKKARRRTKKLTGGHQWRAVTPGRLFPKTSRARVPCLLCFTEAHQWRAVTPGRLFQERQPLTLEKAVGFHAKGAKHAEAEGDAKDWIENVSPPVAVLNLWFLTFARIASFA